MVLVVFTSGLKHFLGVKCILYNWVCIISTWNTRKRLKLTNNNIVQNYFEGEKSIEKYNILFVFGF